MKTYYIAHKLLNSQYKFLINLIIYSLLIYAYNIYIDKTIISECMMRSNSFPSLQADTHLASNDLVYENAHLNERVLMLRQESESLRDHCLTERIENEYIIGILEENQKYLIAEKRTLQAKLLESNQTINTLTCDNLDLKEKFVMQRNYNEVLRRNLEISQERVEDLSKALLNVTKNKTNEKKLMLYSKINYLHWYLINIFYYLDIVLYFIIS